MGWDIVYSVGHVSLCSIFGDSISDNRPHHWTWTQLNTCKLRRRRRHVMATRLLKKYTSTKVQYFSGWQDGIGNEQFKFEFQTCNDKPSYLEVAEPYTNNMFKRKLSNNTPNRDWYIHYYYDLISIGIFFPIGWILIYTS